MMCNSRGKRETDPVSPKYLKKLQCVLESHYKNHVGDDPQKKTQAGENLKLKLAVNSETAQEIRFYICLF